MLREDDASFTHDGDRALRDELEQLQSEIRRARDAKAAFPADARKAEAALEDSIARAKARRTAAAERLTTLEAERHALERSVAQLDARVSAKQEEDKLLALGASRRDQVIEWLPQQKPYSQKTIDRMNIVAAFLFALVIAFAIASSIR